MANPVPMRMHVCRATSVSVRNQLAASPAGRPALSYHPGRAGVRGARVVVRASERREDADVAENRQVLDAFFVGRALAEVVNEKVGSALGEILSEVAKKDAERRRDLRDFQDEVRKRARDQQSKAMMTSVPYAENDNPAAAASPTVASSADSVPGPDEPDLGNSVQELESEVSQARKAVNEFKNASKEEEDA
eukprot:CAMPEP_0114226430 /NCGR_PEP_ID=MMETSP0058-20121206/1233_1 /TAXON_ID=36894 /ORGANISM="Pyramimonas parkeae, CCMP726" /LENGTH=191 /DNA_ID=CAMNT_0001337165 /DNA_START=73 /DNA_END=648 /DNA_ORIENTATION=-